MRKRLSGRYGSRARLAKLLLPQTCSSGGSRAPLSCFLMSASLSLTLLPANSSGCTRSGAYNGATSVAVGAHSIQVHLYHRVDKHTASHVQRGTVAIHVWHWEGARWAPAANPPRSRPRGCRRTRAPGHCQRPPAQSLACVRPCASSKITVRLGALELDTTAPDLLRPDYGVEWTKGLSKLTASCSMRFPAQ